MNNLLTPRDRQSTNINSHRRTRNLDVILPPVASVLALVVYYLSRYKSCNNLLSITSLVIVLQVQDLEFS